MITFTVKESPSGKLIKTANEVVDSIRGIGNADQESYWVIGCNWKNKEIFRKCLFLGATDSVNIDRKLIFRRLLGSGASSWIEVHNHPSGDSAPSKEDVDNALELESMSKLLGLHLIDSIIIGDDDFFSFAYEGFLPGKPTNTKAVHQQKRNAREREVAWKEYSNQANSDPFSTHRRKYLELKREHPDAILFFNMENFYEMFFDDAEVASRILDIPLITQGPYRGSTLPRCAVPVHFANSAIGKLVDGGWKVAICEKGSEKEEKKPIHRLIIPGSLDRTGNTVAGDDQGDNGQGKRKRPLLRLVK